MLINTDIQLALAQLGVIMDIDKQLRDLLDNASKKRMVSDTPPVIALLKDMREAENHLIRILTEKTDKDLYVIDRGKRIGIGEAYERYAKH